MEEADHHDVAVLVGPEDVHEEPVHLPLVPAEERGDPLDSLRAASSELDTGVYRQPTVEQLVGSLRLGVGLLQEGGPELHQGV